MAPSRATANLLEARASLIALLCATAAVGLLALEWKSAGLFVQERGRRAARLSTSPETGTQLFNELALAGGDGMLSLLFTTMLTFCAAEGACDEGLRAPRVRHHP